jgi:hypothetical protein
VSPLKIKIPVKNLGRQRCAEEFNPGIQGLNMGFKRWKKKHHRY